MNDTLIERLRYHSATLDRPLFIEAAARIEALESLGRINISARDKFLARIEALEAALRDKTGWIIEQDDPPVYHLVSGDHDEHWTDDVNKALRFARKEDAEAYLDHVGWTSPPVRTAEHMWPMPRIARDALDKDAGK